MSKNKREALSLRSAKWTKLHELEFDNKSYGDFWFLRDCDQIILARQPRSGPVEEKIHIPRRIFNFFVDAYMKPQKKVTR